LITSAKPKLDPDEVRKEFLAAGWSPEGTEEFVDRLHEYETQLMVRRFMRKKTGIDYAVNRPLRIKKKAYIARSLRTRVFERDAYRCRRCGTWLDLTVDHIFPESRGGTLDMSNLQTLCRTCNCKKGDRIQ
jgi:5-methylcytosine-specific restriction endonuclease McrA